MERGAGPTLMRGHRSRGSPEKAASSGENNETANVRWCAVDVVDGVEGDLAEVVCYTVAELNLEEYEDLKQQWGGETSSVTVNRGW